MLKVTAIVVLAALAAGGCGSTVPAAGPYELPRAVQQPAAPAPAASAALPHYRCDQGIEFTVRFVDDTAVLDSGPRGSDVLLRDAGGATPQQTVYSNPRVRAEFGLGSTGREAILRYVTTAQIAHCMQG